MKVAFFGAYDPSYPRTRVLREGLEAHGAEVVAIQVPVGAPVGLRELELALRWLGRAHGLDAVLVPSFGHRDVPLAGLLGRAAGAPVLFDPLVSRWDTQVGDLGRLAPGSLSAGRMRASDRLSLRLADEVLCDTWEHGDFFASEFGVDRRKLARIPVGADTFAFTLGDRRAPHPSVGVLDVVFVGGYLPLHGVRTVIEAASLLEERHGTRIASFTLIGSGMTLPTVERDVAAGGLTTVRLCRRMPYEDALARLARADLALGIFGTTPKAARVVPHKVFQAMALGLPVVTRRSAAIAEFFRDDEHLVLVPAGDAAALARAIEALAADPERRNRMGDAARLAVRAQGSPTRIGELLLETIDRVRSTSRNGRRR